MAITIEEYRNLDNKKQSKYKAKKYTVNGITFDSTKEGKRYEELLMLERAGVVQQIETQVRFKIEVNGMLVCTYIADFTYYEDGVFVVEDVKSDYTKKLPVYRLKKKLMSAVRGIDITEA